MWWGQDLGDSYPQWSENSGWESLSFGDPDIGLSSVVTADWQREIFIIGDAAMPTWFRFGVGIDDAKYGARTVVACSALSEADCERLLTAHEQELSRRAVQVYFNLWYNSRWKHRGGSEPGTRLNQMILKLAQEASAAFEKRRDGSCPKAGFITAEDWSADDTSKSLGAPPNDLTPAAGLIRSIITRAGGERQKFFHNLIGRDKDRFVKRS